MERDEGGTFERLQAARKAVVKPVLSRHGGRFVDLKGDGAIIEFSSVLAAVQAAVEIQQMMLEQDAELPEAERTRYRIGINLGDVARAPFAERPLMERPGCQELPRRPSSVSAPDSF